MKLQKEVSSLVNEGLVCLNFKAFYVITEKRFLKATSIVRNFISLFTNCSKLKHVSTKKSFLSDPEILRKMEIDNSELKNKLQLINFSSFDTSSYDALETLCCFITSAVIGKVNYKSYLNVENIKGMSIVLEAPTQSDARSRVSYSLNNAAQREDTLCCIFSKLLNGYPDSSFLSPEKRTKSNAAFKTFDEQTENVKGFPGSLMFAVLGWSGSKPNISIEIYDTFSEKWFYLRQKNFIRRAYHGVVAIGILIYVIGGFDGRRCHDSAYCFHTVKRSWSRKSRMQETRCYVTAVGHRGIVYAIGGFDGDSRSKTCERFNPRSRRWQYVASMNHRRSDASGAVFKEKIYICGGFDGINILISAEMYDFKSNQWTLIAPLLGPRSGHCMVSSRGSVVVMGGFDGLSRLLTVEIFDEEENCWKSHVSMLSPRSNFAAAAMGNQMFVFGGYNGSTTFSEAEKFDDKTQKWYKMNSLNYHRSALGACVLNNYEAFSTCSLPDEMIIRRGSLERSSP